MSDIEFTTTLEYFIEQCAKDKISKSTTEEPISLELKKIEYTKNDCIRSDDFFLIYPIKPNKNWEPLVGVMTNHSLSDKIVPFEDTITLELAAKLIYRKQIIEQKTGRRTIIKYNDIVLNFGHSFVFDLGYKTTDGQNLAINGSEEEILNKAKEKGINLEKYNLLDGVDEITQIIKSDLKGDIFALIDPLNRLNPKNQA